MAYGSAKGRIFRGDIYAEDDSNKDTFIDWGNDYISFAVGGTKVLNVSASGAIVKVAGTLTASGNISASSFYGDGSNLTDISSVSVDVSDSSANSEFRLVGVAASGVGVTLTTMDTAADLITINASTGKLTLAGPGIAIGSADVTEAEFEFLDGATAGTAVASKALVLNGSSQITSGINALFGTVLGAGQKLKLGGTTILSSSIVAGTAAASSLVLLDSSKDIVGLNDVSAAGLTLSDLTSGRLITVGASGLLEDQAALGYEDDRSEMDGYLALYVSSSASGSAYLGDGMLFIGDENDDDIFSVNATSADFEVEVNFNAVLNADAAAVLSSAKVSDLTSGRVLLAGTAGELEDNASFTYDGSTLQVLSKDGSNGSIYTKTGSISVLGAFGPIGQITDTGGFNGQSGSFAANVIISGSSDTGLSVNSLMTGGASITAVGHINAGSTGGGNFEVVLNSNGNISGSGNLQAGGGGTFAGNVIAEGNLNTTAGNISGSGALMIGGQSTLNGDVNIASSKTLGVNKISSSSGLTWTLPSTASQAVLWFAGSGKDYMKIDTQGRNVVVGSNYATTNVGGKLIASSSISGSSTLSVAGTAQFGGKVGIGLTPSTYSLEIDGYVSLGNGSGAGYIISRGDENTFLRFGPSGSDSMALVCGGKQLLLLDENGNDKVVLGSAVTDLTHVSGNLRQSGSNPAEFENGLETTTLSASSTLQVAGSTLVAGNVISVGNLNTTAGNISGSGALMIGGQSTLNGDVNIASSKTLGVNKISSSSGLTWTLPSTASQAVLWFAGSGKDYMKIDTQGRHVVIGSNYADVNLNNTKVSGTLSASGDFSTAGNGTFGNIGSAASAGALHYTATGVLTTNTSDERLKDDITTIDLALDKVKALRGVYHTWKEDIVGERNIGAVAQEVAAVIPELAFTNDNTGYMGVHYDKLSALLIEAIKEQSEIIEELQHRVNNLEDQES